MSKGVIVTKADELPHHPLAGLKGKNSAQRLTSNWARVAKNAGANVESVEGSPRG